MSNPSPMRGKPLVPNLRYERNLKGYGRFKSYAVLSKILKTSQGYASFYIYVWGKVEQKGWEPMKALSIIKSFDNFKQNKFQKIIIFI